MPPRRSARAKPASVKAEAAVIPDAPSTPKKGKKRGRSTPEPTASEAPPSKKQELADGTPRRPDGRAYVVPIDMMVSPSMASSHHVYVDGVGEVYDAMLNQTNVGGNNNKFYILQLLQPHKNEGDITLYTRWGRVGEDGKNQTKGPFDPTTAVKEFCKQFKAKSGADFSKRTVMTPKPGKYTWLDKAYDDVDAEDAAGTSASPQKGKGKEESDLKEEPVPESIWPIEIQSLVSFLFNQDNMKAHLLALNYDVNKQPLGKLGPTTVANGFQALKDLAEVINEPQGARSTELGGFREACTNLTNRYYTVIPHAFGRRRPTVIDSEALVKIELDLVGSLGDMEMATEIISSSLGKNSQGKRNNETDSKLASLDLKDISVVDKQSGEFQGIEMYAKNTNEGMDAYSTSNKMQVLEAFRIERNGEEERWNNSEWGKQTEDRERLLLWHGSRTTNFVGILKQGLRIAPPEAPVTGYEFGKGVYFGDMLGISANYTHAHLSSNIGLLLLCEVVAKPYLECYEFDFHADQTSKKAGKVATKALGKLQHEDWIDAGDKFGRDDLKGIKMPGGHAKDLSSTFPRPSVKVEDVWNEYIVYDVSQIRIRYLLQVQL